MNDGIGERGIETLNVRAAQDQLASRGQDPGARNATGIDGIAQLSIAVNARVAQVTDCGDTALEIFSRQLVGRARPRDVLLLLSVGGRSANLVRAARVGRELGMTVLAALGNAGGLARLADRPVVFGQGDYGLTEDLHVSLGHMAVRVLRGGAACRYKEIGDPGASLQV